MENNDNKELYHVKNVPFPAYTGSDDYIFISYSHKDSKVVFEDLKGFYENGFNVWYDQGIRAGRDWAAVLDEAISNCKLFVVFISPNSVTSKNVRKEISIAEEEDRDIIPIFIEDTKLKGRIRYQLVDTQGILRFAHEKEDYTSEYVFNFKSYGIKVNEPRKLRGSKKSSKKQHINIRPKIRIKSKKKAAVAKKFEQPENFTYLEKMISLSKTVFLENDIKISNSEEETFKEGIILNKDDMIIEGNNHTIDANSISRIFKVTANNITIKNLTLKNGYVSEAEAKHSDGGGAIIIEQNSSLTLKNCEFLDNYSEGDGGAIFNEGTLTDVKYCIFRNNSSKASGGTLANFNIANITRSNFKNNESNNGAVIYNSHNTHLNIKSSNFNDNKSLLVAGVIYNYGRLKIEDNTSFNDNSSRELGGAILNMGIAEVFNAKFYNNSSNNGGAITNMNTYRTKNYSFDPKIFENELGLLSLKDCEFNSNTAKNNGGVISNYNLCKVENCIFNSTTVDNKDSHIITNGKEDISHSIEDGTYYSILLVRDCDFNVKSEEENDAIFNCEFSLLKVSSNLYSENNIILNRGKLELL